MSTISVAEFEVILASYHSNGLQNVKLGLGLHPHFLATHNSVNAVLFTAAAKNCDFIGEVGLDFLRRGADRNLQIEAFYHVLTVASELGRTVSIHCLRAWDALFDALAAFKNECFKLHFHAFSGSREIAERLLSHYQADVYFSINADQLEPQRLRTLSAVAAIPSKNLLVETDATSEKFTSFDQYEQYLKLGYERLSSIKGMSFDEFTQQLRYNFNRCFDSV